MKEKEYNFTINDNRRRTLEVRPDYYLIDSSGNEISIIFEKEADTYLVFAKEKNSRGVEKELGGGLAFSYHNAIIALLGNRYLPFYSLQIPSDSVK